MPPKIRKALLVVLTLIFILIGTTLILYSRGIRFDFKEWQIVQTGGIYLKTEPADVDIRINGKPVKDESGILQSGTLVTNLKPGIYNTFLQKQGYYSWEKDIRVESSTVAVFDGIILFPQEKSELVASPTDKFYLELNREVISETERVGLINLFNQLKGRQLRLPGPVPVSKVLPYPYNDRKFIIMTDRALYSLDTEKKSISQVSSHAKDFAFAGNEVFWFNETGLSSFNLILRNQSQINLPPELNPSEWQKIQPSPSGEIIAILKKDNELIVWDRSLNKVTSLGRGIASFVFSPDSKKIAFVHKKNSLNVYAIKDEVKKERFILENFSNNWTGIKEILWHGDNNYLFLRDASDKLYFVEVNDYPPVNVVEVATEIKNFIYSKEDSSLYFENTAGVWRIKL